MKWKLFIIVALSVGMHTGADAGKIDDIMAAAKQTCDKDIPKARAIKLVKKLYLTCKAGQRVDVDGCKILCLKSSSGAVVGSH